MTRRRFTCSPLILVIPALPALACGGALHIEPEHASVYALTCQAPADLRATGSP